MNAPLTRQHHLLAAIGHASRFRLFLLLAEQERCVSELAADVGLSQSCTTRHVQALIAAGVAHAQREGKRVRVRLRLERPEVAGLLAWARLGALESVAPWSPARAPAPASRARRASAPATTRRAGTPAPPVRAPARRAAPAPVVPDMPQATAISATTPSSEPRVAVRPVRRDLEDYLL